MADPKTPEKKTYVVQTATWIGPHLKQVDEEVEMTEEEARYYVPHILKLKEDEAKAAKPKPKAAKG